MGQGQKFFLKILQSSRDQNIDFAEMCAFLKKLDFKERIKGSHHIFYREDIDEIINLQPKGRLAKSYQVKQVRNLLIKYKLEVN